MLSDGSISVALIAIDETRTNVTVLSILAAFCWLYALLTLVDTLQQSVVLPKKHKSNSLSYRAEHYLEACLFLGFIAVGIYWIDHLILKPNTRQSQNTTVRRLQVSLASVFILSTAWCSIRSYNKVVNLTENNRSQSAIMDMDMKRINNTLVASSKNSRVGSDSTTAAGSALGSSVNTNSDQTVKVKDSTQTLALGLASKCYDDFSTEKSAESEFWTANHNIITRNSVFTDKPAERMNSWESKSSNLEDNDSAKQKLENTTNDVIAKRSSIEADETAEYEDLSRPVFRFPEPISEEVEESKAPKFTFPPNNKYMQAYEDASMGSLENLSDIPEHSADRWPLFSTGSELVTDNQDSLTPNSSKSRKIKMNHVSPESWQLNSDHWQKNRERIGFNNGVMTSTSRIDQGWSESSEEPKFDAIKEQNETKLIKNMTFGQDHSEITSTNEKVYNTDLEILSTPKLEGKADLVKTAKLNPEKSFQSPLKRYSPRLSSLDSKLTPSGPTTKDSRLSLKIGGVLRNSRSIPMLRTSLTHNRSHSVLGIFSRSTPSSPKGHSPSKYSLTSPIKGLRNVRFGSRENLRNQRYIPKHCGHSKSVPELNFEFIQSLQNSPTHKRSVTSFKGHRRATSSITYKSSPKKRALHRKNSSRLMLVEAHNETSLVVQGNDASSTTSDLSSSDSLEEESVNSVPSMLIGQYDREKWRVIRRKQLSEVAI